MNSITEAVARFTANLKRGSFVVSYYHGCAIVQAHAEETDIPVLNESGQQISTRRGLPEGHSGWDCTVIGAEGSVIGTFTNLGKAIEAAAAGTVEVSGAPAPSPEAPVPAQTQEEAQPQGTAENPQEETGR